MAAGLAAVGGSQGHRESVRNMSKNEFDAYRDALVMETATLWPDDLSAVDAARRRRVEQALHSQPQQAAQLEYVRTHSGFCRRITVSDADLARIS